MTDKTTRGPKIGSRAIRMADIRRTILKAARYRARKQGVPFNLTLDDIAIPDVCPVLGMPLELGHGRPTDASPSLDKVVPALGYVSGNVVVVSNRANRAKSNLAVHELRAVADFYEKHMKNDWMKQCAQPS